MLAILSINIIFNYLQGFSQFLIIMPLVALIIDAVQAVGRQIPQVSAVHLTPATINEARSAVLIFASPETILDDVGRSLCRSIASHIKAIFIDEFHIVAAW